MYFWVYVDGEGKGGRDRRVEAKELTAKKKKKTAEISGMCKRQIIFFTFFSKLKKRKRDVLFLK